MYRKVQWNNKRSFFIPKVKEVSETWGIHDIFVKIQTESMDELNDICKDIIHMNGIEPTVILESVNEYMTFIMR